MVVTHWFTVYVYAQCKSFSTSRNIPLDKRVGGEGGNIEVAVPYSQDTVCRGANGTLVCHF